MKCSHCSNAIDGSRNYCPYCGHKVGSTTQVQKVDSNVVANTQSDRNNLLAVIGFTLGLLSWLVNPRFLISVVSIIISVIGIHQIRDTKEKGKTFAVLGIVFSIGSIIYLSVMIYIGILDLSLLLAGLS